MGTVRRGSWTGFSQKSFFVIDRPVRDREIRRPHNLRLENGVWTEGIDDLLELGFKEEHSGATVLDDKFKFRPGQSPVEGNKNGADFRKGKKDFNVLMAIVKKNGNPIPLLDPLFQKEMAELIGPEIYFLVGEGTILKDRDASSIRLKKTPFFYPVTDVDHFRNASLNDRGSRVKPRRVIPNPLIKVGKH